MAVREFNQAAYTLVRCLVLEIIPMLHRVEIAVARGDSITELVQSEQHNQARRELLPKITDFNRRLSEMRGVFYEYVVEHEGVSVSDIAASNRLRRQTVAELIRRARGR